MLFMLMTCSVFLQLSTANLINAIKSRQFRHVDLQNDSPLLQELSNLVQDAKRNCEFDGRCKEHSCAALGDALRYAASATYTGENSKLICELLLNNGADVNSKDCQSWTPLMHAAVLNNLDVVDLFLRKGADPNYKNYEGKTALDIISKPCIFHNYDPVTAKIKEFHGLDLLNAIWALQFRNANLQKGSPELQELLTLVKTAVKESEIDSHGCHGCSALSLTIQSCDYFTGKNSKFIFELLQNNGADVNKRKDNGVLPLFVAVCTNNPELVEFLLRRGANPYLTWESKTVFDLAAHNTFDKCAPVLQLYMENKGWAILNLNLNTFFIQNNINYGPVRAIINEFLGYHLQPKKSAKIIRQM